MVLRFLIVTQEFGFVIYIIYAILRVMNESSVKKSSIILNSIIFLLTAYATTCMILGINFSGRSKEVLAFTASNMEAFKYFTVDSNVLAGITALIYLIIEAKGKELSQRACTFLHCLRLAAASGVTLTMLVTAFFLIPQFGKHWYILYIDNNFFFHLTIPLLCVITYIFFEPGAKILTFKQSLTGIIPMLLYAVVYTINIILHLGNGEPLKTVRPFTFGAYSICMNSRSWSESTPNACCSMILVLSIQSLNSPHPDFG